MNTNEAATLHVTATWQGDPVHLDITYWGPRRQPMTAPSLKTVAVDQATADLILERCEDDDDLTGVEVHDATNCNCLP